MTEGPLVYLITSAFCLSSYSVNAQIITDRPTIAPDARIAVEKGSAQVEATVTIMTF
ncbi:MAG: hypothetical protein GXO48_01545 [Chlorobi bacterium]|nr:hypothetical protein [Chlorobiota bacterium]